MQAPSFSVQISSSRWLPGYLTGLHLLLLVCLLFLPKAAMLSIVFPVVLHWRYSLWRYADSEHCRWVKGVRYANKVWQLQAGTQHVSASLVHATVWRWLVVMNFYSQDTGCTYSVLLFSDSADPSQLRQLRVILRHMPVFDS